MAGAEKSSVLLIFHKAPKSNGSHIMQARFDFSTMEVLLGLDDSAWQGWSVCVGVKGGVLRAVVCYGGFCVKEGLQSLRDSFFPVKLPPPGRVRAHDRVYLRPVAEPAWRNY